MAEQIPGTLFILLVALAAYMLGDARPILILALGCAAGWQTFNPDRMISNWARAIALVLWVAAFLFLLIKVI